MYPNKGNNPYGQQSYSQQQGYGQIAGAGYSGNSAAQSSLAGGGAQDVNIGTYRAYSSQAPQYGGAYASLYGSSAVPTAQQAGGVVNQGTGSSSLQGHTGYASGLADSSKLSSGAGGFSLGVKHDDYASTSNLGYGQRGDQFSGVKTSDYPSMDYRSYPEHQATYMGRGLQSDAARRYPESVPHKSEMQDQLDQASLLRQQQMLKASLQSGLDMRQADYTAARAAPAHHGLQEYSSYGGRIDADPRTLAVLSGTPYGGQHSASILGGAPRRNVDNLLYAQGSSGVGYGVGLPPGRDYVAGKGLHGSSLESDYQGSVLSRAHPSLGVSLVDGRKDDTSGLRRELDMRDEERRRERMRDREKEREREERERERERERDRERERSRLLERRDKERERDRKRAPDLRRERTPPRSTRERRASSIKDERPPRRVSPRREILHRPRSPVKEKRRDYMCKVFPYCFVEVERDYLSLNKRYPKLSISPDFSKVVVNWPKQSLKLSLHTPVSFEHVVLEPERQSEEKGLVPLVGESSMVNGTGTVWNAKVILMSGVSTGAMNELCSEKSSDDKIIHFNNILKFALIRKDHSFMAIGGPYNAVRDGGDPPDDSSLIQTALRHVKDLTQLELQNCQHWNRFLEIHYDRVGKDGLFSHKEVTVLFVPDLSDCLPSVELWQSQWLAHKKDVAERERQLSLKQDKQEIKKKDIVHDKNSCQPEVDTSAKAVKTEDILGKDAKDAKKKIEGTRLEKKCDVENDRHTTNEISESKKGEAAQKSKGPSSDGDQIVKEDEQIVAQDDKTTGKVVEVEIINNLEVGVQKPAKKKVIRKVIKKKVVAKKEAVEDSVTQNEEELDVKNKDDNQVNQKTVVQEGGSSASPLNVKTFVRKKIVKKVPLGKSPAMEENATDASVVEPENTPGNELENQGDQAKDNREPDGTPQGAVVKTTGKKKVIKKVIRKKVAKTEEDICAVKMENREEVNIIRGQDANEGEFKKKQDDKIDEGSMQNSKSEINKTEKLGSSTLEKQVTVDEKKKAETEVHKDNTWDHKISMKEKGGSRSSVESEVAKVKDTKKCSQENKDRTNDEKKTKCKDANPESKPSAGREVKGKGKSEEPPERPGLFLRTKQTKESKIRSVSLSLDWLLGYTEEDIQESTFEISLFAESFYEMLQYQMGCRILSFLEKLRRRFVTRRSQKKRQRDENSEKGSDRENTSQKRHKIDDIPAAKNGSPKSEKQDTSNPDGNKKMVEDGSTPGDDESMVQKKPDDNDAEEDNEEEEDPEEIIEDDEDMHDASPSNEVPKQKDNAGEKGELKIIPEKASTEDESSGKFADNTKDKETPKTDEIPDNEKEDMHSNNEKPASAKDEVVDKELLQAFRFFDHNYVGYIRVEDLRCIIHNLGKFLPHRDVKELVQSALFETNSARDNRIFYKKLVRLSNI